MTWPQAIKLEPFLDAFHGSVEPNVVEWLKGHEKLCKTRMGVALNNSLAGYYHVKRTAHNRHVAPRAPHPRSVQNMYF
jgi:hypothetical protein